MFTIIIVIIIIVIIIVIIDGTLLLCVPRYTIRGCPCPLTHTLTLTLTLKNTLTQTLTLTHALTLTHTLTLNLTQTPLHRPSPLTPLRSLLASNLHLSTPSSSPLSPPQLSPRAAPSGGLDGSSATLLSHTLKISAAIEECPATGRSSAAQCRRNEVRATFYTYSECLILYFLPLGLCVPAHSKLRSAGEHSF